MTAPASAPRRRGDLLSDDAGMELVVFDPRRQLAHILNETAAVVFLLCNGRSVNAIIAELERIPGALGRPLAEEVESVLEAFRQQDLLESA